MLYLYSQSNDLYSTYKISTPSNNASSYALAITYSGPNSFPDIPSLMAAVVTPVTNALQTVYGIDPSRVIFPTSNIYNSTRLRSLTTYTVAMGTSFYVSPNTNLDNATNEIPSLTPQFSALLG